MSARGRAWAGRGGAQAQGSTAPDARRGARRPTSPPNADVAAVLAILAPGSGHLYAGRPRAALLWLLVILAGYWAVQWPGFVLHALSIFSARRAAAGRDGGPESPGRHANP